MKNLTTKQAKCLKIMKKASVVYLTTIDKNGVPSTRAMLNLKNSSECPGLTSIYEAEENPLTVFMITNASSSKFAEIQQNRKSCLYYCELEKFHSVLLQGTVEIITDNNLRRKAWQKDWEIYYPKGDSDYTLLRFIPVNLKIYADSTIETEKT
jgi:general stress protein 26